MGRYSCSPGKERICILDHWLVGVFGWDRRPKKLTWSRFNLLGQVAVTTGITFGGANLISITATIGTSYKPTAGKTLGIYAALLISHGMVNSFGVHTLRFFNTLSVILHSLGVASFAIAVLAKAPTHQSAKFVFATFNDGTGDPGWSIRASPAYGKFQCFLNTAPC